MLMRLTLQEALEYVYVCYNCIYWDIDTHKCTVDNTDKDEEDAACADFEVRDLEHY